MATFNGAGTILFEDQFVYSDGTLTSVGSANWTNGFWTGQPSLIVSSNKVIGGSSVWGDNYTNSSFSVGTGVELIARGVTKAGSGTSTFFYCMGTAAASPSGYWMSVHAEAGTDSLRCGYITTGSYTNLVSVSQELTNGDDLGMQITSGGTISLWHRPAAGSWGQVGTDQSNSTYTSGRVAMEFFESLSSAEGIELRSMTSASTAVRRRALMGVGV